MKSSWNKHLVLYHTFLSSFVIQGEGERPSIVRGSMLQVRSVMGGQSTPDRQLPGHWIMRLVRIFWKTRKNHIILTFLTCSAFCRNIPVAGRTVFKCRRYTSNRTLPSPRQMPSSGLWDKHNGGRSVSSVNIPDFTQKYKLGQTPRCGCGCVYWSKETWRSTRSDRNA